MISKLFIQIQNINKICLSYMIKKSSSYSSHWLMSQIWINLEDILNYKICSKKNSIFIKFFKEVASLFNVRIC